MKTRNLSIIAVCVALLMTLTSCLSTSGSSSINYKKRAETGTPENSVILVFFYSNNSQMTFSQCDSEYPPDNQELIGPYFVSAPVAPGSRYRLQYVNGSFQSGQTVWYWTNTYSMQVNGFDIKVPDEPGIYYVGYFSGQDSYRQGSPSAITKTGGLLIQRDADPKEQEKECLEEALNVYRGTEWFDVIKQRLGELKK